METKKKKSIFKKWWFWVLIIIVIIGIKAASGSGDSKTNSGTDKAAKTSTTKTEDTKVTYKNFLKITMGMKYSDVTAILGEGKEDSSSEVSGIKTKIYSWNGSGISNMNVTVQNDVVTGKTQLSLQPTDSKITLDKYNQVKEGMTYEQVKAILGEGEITSQVKIMDAESIIYSWVNKDGSNANFTFSGNKLEAKAQLNLK